MFKLKKLIISFGILVSFSLWAQSIKPSECTFVFQSQMKSVSSIQDLSGNWEFYWDKTPDQIYALLNQYASQGKDFSEAPDAIVNIPGFWNDDIEKITGEKKSIGKGTYRMIVSNLIPNYNYALLINESPGTSCAIYINGNRMFSTGDPYNLLGKHKSHSVIKPVYFTFAANQNGVAEIVIFVNNYFHRLGGLWDTVKIGSATKVFNQYTLLTGFYLFAFGILLFIGILNLIQYFMNISQRQYLYVSLISFASACRVSVAGFCSLGILFPNLPAELKIKIEYIAIWLIPAVYYVMMIHLYPENFQKVFKVIPVGFFRHTFLIFSAVLGLASFVTPAKICNRLVPIFELSTIFGIINGLFILIPSIVKRKKYVAFHLAGVIVLMLGLGFDFTFSRVKGVMAISYFPLFMALFSTVQLTMLSKLQQDLFDQSEQMTSDLQSLNISYIRYVPYEFLKLLKKDSVTSIELGDHTNIDMSILFSKISVFDVKNSTIPSPEVQYEVYCEFLKTVSMYITRNNGFISKFLSGGLIALFPDNNGADEAIYAALHFEECITKMNAKYKERGLSIKAYTGVHYGNMILGTVGAQNRLDDTVISDTVNTVARIESVCERLNKPLIISEELVKNSTPTAMEGILITRLQQIPIKGKRNQLNLFDCSISNGFNFNKINSAATFSEENIENLEEVDELEEL